MVDSSSSKINVPQRMVRPLNFPPGHWKKQLPKKYLDLAVKGKLDGMRQLLEIHPEYLNKRGSHNRTFLWEAARKGNLPLVKWLLEQGAEIDATGCYNAESFVQLTPFSAAIYYKRPDAAEILQFHGAKTDIFRAVFLGNIEQAAQELTANPGLIHAEDPFDNIYYVPLLSFAIVGRKMEMIEFLLDRGAQVPPYSLQLMSLAAKHDRKDILDLLLYHNTQVPALGETYFYNTYPLDILRYFLEHGASPTTKGENGFPPLIYLCRADKGEHAGKIKLLLEYHSPVNAVGPKGRTALHYAAAAGFQVVMNILLEYGADTNMRDHHGESPLDLARRYNRLAAAELLEEHGASG